MLKFKAAIHGKVEKNGSHNNPKMASVISFWFFFLGGGCLKGAM